MADVELILHVDNTDALAKIKQTQLAAAEMQREISGKGDERVKLLQKEVDELGKLGEAQKKAFDTDKLDDYNRTVGEGTETLEEYGEETDVAEKKTTSMAGTAAKAAIVLAALKLAYEALVKIMTATGVGADKFKVAIAGVKGGLDQLWRSIATGNMKELGKQMKAAADEARRYQRVLFEIADLDRRLRVEESRVGIEIEKNQRIIDSEVATISEKKVALTNIIELETKLNDFRSKIAIKTYGNIIQNLVDMTGQEEALVKAYIEGDEALLDKIAIGNKYNKSIDELNKLTSGTGGQIKNAAALREQVSNMTEEEKKYAELAAAFGIPVRELWVEATESMIDVQEASNAQMPISEAAAEKLNTTLADQKDEIVSVANAYFQAYNYAKMFYAQMKKEEEEYAKGLLEESFKVPFEATGNSFWLTPEMVKRGEEMARESWEKINKEELEAKRKLEADKLAIQQATFEAANALASASFEIIGNLQEQSYREEVEALDALTQRKLASAGSDIRERERIMREYDAERKRIDDAYAKKQQNLAITEATILGAVAIVQAWAEEKSWVAALARSLAAAAVTIAQISVIKSQPLEKGGSGDETGIIKGRRHSHGGERFLDHVEVEAGEAWGVLSRPATSKFGKEFHDIVSSFNRGEMPQFPSVSNSILVNNDGSNSRLDKLIVEQRKLNDKYGRESQMIVSEGKRIIKKGNKIRIIG